MFEETAVLSADLLNSYAPITMCYIDPGTGSMLFTIVIGLISTVIYSLRGVILKLKFGAGSKAKENQTEKHDYVIFSDSKRYWNIFEGICDRFEELGLDLTYMTMSEDDEVFNKGYKNVKTEYIGNGNGAFAKLNFLNADIVISTTPGLDVYQWKRSKNVKYYVHIPHMVNDISTYRMFGLDYYDAVLTVNKVQTEQVRECEKIRELKAKEIKEVGCTYFDRMKMQLEKANPIDKKETTILLAPSWGESAILKRFGEKMIDALIATGYKVIVRPHPQSFTSEKELMDQLMNKYPNIEWNRDRDNLEVLRRSDILISDFSGVIFDYSLVLDKPVIYTNTSFDKSPYDAWWIEDDLWTFKILPEIGKELTEDNFTNIKGLIDECLNEPRFKEGRDRIRKEAWPYISKSTENIVDYLLKKKEELE